MSYNLSCVLVFYLLMGDELVVKFYAFLSSTGVWIAAVCFLAGLTVRVTYLIAISREKDKVLFNHFDVGWSFRSILHWLLPLGSVSLRRHPVFGLVFFIFHAGLFIVPLFLAAHNILFQQAFGWSLPFLPDSLADGLTLIVIGCIVFLFARRLVLPEVRILSSGLDYFLLILTASPFVTGYLAYHQWGDYQFMMVLHVLLSEVLLILIPFTKLGHLVLFFFTRAFIGSEMGARRERDGRVGARAW